MNCEECDTSTDVRKISLSDSSSDDDSDSPFRSYHWEDKIIVLGPDDAWEKPEGHVVFLTQVSISPPHGATGMSGILAVMAKEFNVVLAKLTRENPMQQLRLAFNDLQEVILLNNGNRQITVALMVRH